MVGSGEMRQLDHAEGDAEVRSTSTSCEACVSHSSVPCEPTGTPGIGASSVSFLDSVMIRFSQVVILTMPLCVYLSSRIHRSGFTDMQASKRAHTHTRHTLAHTQ